MARVIFSNGALFDGENATRAGATVVVEGRHIQAVTDEAITPGPDDQSVDLAGRTLMPGMILCHFHTGFGPDAGGAAPVLGLNRPAAYLGMVAAKNAQLAIDNGVTSIIGSSNGDGLDVALKEAILVGLTRGPRIVACTREFMASGDPADGTNHAWHMDLGNLGLIRRVDGVDAMRQAVREEIGRGCEIVKLSISRGHGAAPTTEDLYYTPEEIRVAVETAHSRGALVRAHCPSRIGVIECARAGVDIIDHADKIDDEGIEAVIASDATITPSMLWSERYLRFVESWDTAMGPFPISAGLPEAPWETEARLAGAREDYEYTARMLPRMQEAGVRLALGDDYGFPIMPHGDYVAEMEVYLKHGIEPLEILRWATRNGAEAMQRPDELGTVAAGKLADLIVVNGDPTRDLSALRTGIDLVMKDGVFQQDRR